MSTDFNSEIQAELSSLGLDAQRRVLAYVRSLKRHDIGTPGIVVAEFAGTIPEVDLQQMLTAIQDGCEQVDPNEW